jgi:hypothetical protein
MPPAAARGAPQGVFAPHPHGASVALLRRGENFRLGEHRGAFLGDDRAIEEMRVLRAPQPHRVSKGEVAEIVLGDQSALDQLPGFGQRIAHVDYIEMPDIGAVDRIELGAERVGAAKGTDIYSVVGLAAEIIGLGVEPDPILFAGDLAGGEIVAPAGQMRLGIGIAVARPERLGHVVVAVFND